MTTHFHLVPYNWTVGVRGPHHGMIVWVFTLGPLWIEWWTRARKGEW